MAFLELDIRSGFLNSHEEVWVILPDGEIPEGGWPVLWLFELTPQNRLPEE